ncbi:hypothetical protein [Pseudoalteromonas denitrificans]|uniref:Uncharacterized protein n=1 Tax=Pseudoalteromonas denitrificans DSM 6059 TaxID=1123010 RepID=A0A1I1V1W9_9GAMM|nr:hypothetical protein [Pseudoalteromonas denitrificans]SFD76879.1 hypothetical protein SAMN02745724_05403 [Pseudoalteromonas denitrificans DSM 6059]
MKLVLNKKKIKNLSKDHKSLPSDLTPKIGGAYRDTYTNNCPPGATRMNCGSLRC